ncbi:hypothetical protein ACA910_015624 [Epithemia clementina (nom. ined.)]
MGCTSSTEYVVDPATGKEVQKRKLGGNYPGNRRPQHAPYQPPASAFDGTGTAKAHFVAYGGGNALTLVRTNGITTTTATPSNYIEVTLPEGVKAGQVIHVQAPDGQLNEVVVPEGFGPGDVFTVEFASSSTTIPTTTKLDDNLYTTPVAVNDNQTSRSNNRPGDNFASALDNDNNNHHHHANHANNWSEAYPSAVATPVYSPPPQYPSAK